MFTLLKSRYHNMSYKKRACVLLILSVVILLFIATEYLRVDFADIRSVHRAFTGRSSRSNFDWDGWVERNHFLSIGDIYDTCDPKDEARLKVGKTILSYQESTKKIMATIVANLTIADDLVIAKANVYASYRGRILYNETFDLCKSKKVKSLRCPVEKGKHVSVHESGYFPKHMPKLVQEVIVVPIKTRLIRRSLPYKGTDEQLEVALDSH